MTNNSNDGKRRLYFTDKKDLKRTEFTNRGFGSSHPRKDYSSHGETLVKDFQSALQVATSSRDGSVTSDVLIEVETPKNLKIKSVRHQLSEMEIQVIKLDPARENFATASVKKDQVAFLANRLQDYSRKNGNPYKGSVSLIESIQSYQEDLRFIDENINSASTDCIISLYNHLTYNEKVNICTLIVKRLSDLNSVGEVLSFYGTYVLGVSAKLNKDLAELISREFMFIESITINHEVEIASLRVAASAPSVGISLPVPGKSTAGFNIGIVDDGIAKNHMLKPFVKIQSHSLPNGSVNVPRSHGTFVASRAIFGDDFEYLISTGEAVANLHDITVFGIDENGATLPPTEISIIKAIGKAVNVDKNLRIINISLGASAISDGRISKLANFIDETSRTNGIIFTISSGNSERPITRSVAPDKDPLHRIMFPAESIMATTVGSYAKHWLAASSASKDSVSDFSRLGPGFDEGLKPEVVLSGGNSKISKDAAGNEYNDRQSGTGVLGLDAVGGVYEDIGTSFAAPVAANHYACLMVEYPDATMNFYRAMYLHSCANGLSKPLKNIQSRHFHGLGIPDIESILFNTRRSVIKIAEDDLDDSNYLEIPFHVPQAFINRKTKVGIKVTIVFDPDTNSTNPAEYIQSRISASIMKPGPISRRQIDLDGTGENYYKQWSPIISWLSTFERNFQAGEWNLRLRLFTRFGVAKTYKQSFCAIIEVFDPSGNIDVESETQRDFPLKYGITVETAL